MSKLARVFFTLSLILNILLIGLGAGAAYRAYKSRPVLLPSADIKPDTRHMMARTFQHTHREIKKVGAKARDARQEMIAALEADPFDTNRYDSAVARLIESQDEIMEIKMQATRELAQALSVEERKKLAAKLANVFDRSARSAERRLNDIVE